MEKIKPNRYGLYDRPVSFTAKEEMEIDGAALEAQLNEGAFLMNHEDAVRLGFIHPDYEPDSVILGLAEAE